MLENLGFTVLRQIPLEYLTGIAKGVFSVHGGVIRDQAGRIVAHLAIPQVSAALNFVPGLNIIGQVMQTYQLHGLGENVQKVLSVSLASTALSGLGLATSLAGFVYLNGKLRAIEGQIAEIKDWLHSASESQLRAAMSDLSHAGRADDEQTRRQLTLSAKTCFARLAHHYRSQAAGAKTVQELSIYEEYSVASMLGAVMCTSDLGLHEAAAEDLKTFRLEWTVMAREQLRRILDLDSTAALLDSRYVKSLPTADLISVLDFAKGEVRGVGWIDELRTAYGTKTALTANLRPVSDSAISYAKKLRARDDVLSSFEEHFQLLGAKRVGISDFTALLHEATTTGKLAVLIPKTP